MIKTSVLRYAAIGMATVSLAGFAAASTITFDTTGADSNQQVVLNNGSHVHVDNDNHVGVANFNAQGATSGGVTADKNTSISGGVGSGNASNANTTSTGVSVSNSGAGMASALGGWAPADVNVTMHLTGADSTNKVTVDNNRSVSIDNDNNVQVMNLNLQSAKSGSVTANKNTTIGGSVMSGDASNTSTTTTSVSVSN